MTGDPNTIDYEALAQDAMRGVVRTILTRVAKTGLPGDHHFYISFDTLAPGSSLSKRLKEKYPEEMTIVLQHRFWDLIVTEDRFEVKLTFDGIPERLVVPFGAIKVFFDPSVRYGLQFEAPDFGPDAKSHPLSGQDDTAPAGDGDRSPRSAPTPIRATTTRSVSERKPRAPRKTRLDKTSGDVEPATPETARPAPPSRLAEPKPAERSTASNKPDPAPAGGDVQPSAPSGGAQVVSLDAFRKK
jgi:uncharacterized protein